MTLFARLARDSLWLLIARVGAQVCMVIVTWLLARRLSVPEFGEYSFITATILIGNVLTTFGSDMYLIREIAAKGGFSLLSPASILQLVLSGAFILLVFGASAYLPDQTPESIPALRIYSLALIPLAFFTVFTSALRGGQRMGSYAWLNLITAILQVLAIFTFLQRGSGIVTLASLMLGIQTLGAIGAGIFCAANFPGFWNAWRFSLTKTFDLFIACLPIAVIAVLGILYQKTSLALLSILGSASMAGWFSASARVMEAARMGHVAVLTALYPALANAKGNEDSPGTFGLSWRLLFILACGAALLLFLLAEPIVIIFFGVEYRTSIPILKVLSLTIPPYAVNSFLSLTFLAEKREKAVVRALAISLSILVLLNLWLIPRAGGLGAGWAVLIAETIQAALLLTQRRTGSLLIQKGASHDLSDLSRQT